MVRAFNGRGGKNDIRMAWKYCFFGSGDSLYITVSGIALWRICYGWKVYSHAFTNESSMCDFSNHTVDCNPVLTAGRRCNIYWITF